MARATTVAEASSHNVPPAVFLEHYKTIKEARKAHAETGTAVARAKKAAKNAGVDLDALKVIEKWTDIDIDEAELQLKHVRIYAQWLESPLVTQLQMFSEINAPAVDEKTQEEQREWVAGSRGYEAGEAGHSRENNPFDAGTPEFVAWDKSWTRGRKVWLNGQKKIAAEMEPDKEAADGAARPRGRPKKTNGSTEAML